MDTYPETERGFWRQVGSADSRHRQKYQCPRQRSNPRPAIRKCNILIGMHALARTYTHCETPLYNRHSNNLPCPVPRCRQTSLECLQLLQTEGKFCPSYFSTRICDNKTTILFTHKLLLPYCTDGTFTAWTWATTETLKSKPIYYLKFQFLPRRKQHVPTLQTRIIWCCLGTELVFILRMIWN
jgi:hypothetical protein